VLDVLNDFKAKVSFFVVGEMAKKNTVLLQRMTALGHLIGNHNY
jgi:peptidoglycan/xylan/chitin deacetylase (PgdA/CDA1 family)